MLKPRAGGKDDSDVGLLSGRTECQISSGPSSLSNCSYDQVQKVMNSTKPGFGMVVAPKKKYSYDLTFPNIPPFG